METLLIEEAGYDHMTLPQVHMAERRRYLEGRKVLSDIREEQQQAAMNDASPEQERRKRGRKQRAAEHFAQQKGIA